MNLEAYLRTLSLASRGERDLPDLRATLYDGGAGGVVLLSRSVANAAPPGCARSMQVALPLAGLFSWEVGRSRQLVDPNTALFITEGQEFVETHPLNGLGHASLVVVPSTIILDELRASWRQDGDPFAGVTRPATARGQLLANRFLTAPDLADGAGDELMLDFLAELARTPAAPRIRAGSRLVLKAKEFVYSLGAARLSLTAAAAALGVTPVHLSRAFKAAEGTPLYRYYLNMRLNQALARLRSDEPIMDIALALGFSSHSHFTAAFLARYRITPSDYRALSSAPGARQEAHA